MTPGGGQALGAPAAPPPTTSDVLPVTLAVSIVFHALLLLITFGPPDFDPAKFVSQLEVVLVNSKSSSRPAKADALAQANLDGGGNVEADRMAKTNLPKVHDMDQAREVELATSRVRNLEAEAQRLLRAANGELSVSGQVTPSPHSEMLERIEDPAQAQQRLLIAQLEAQISREWEEYQKMPRRKFIGSRTEGVVYAEYVDKWRRQVEKIGTEYLNDEAAHLKLHGSVVMTVHIKADGSVEKIEIDRTSGHRLLDARARRVIDLAGPFSPFPAAVRKDWDVLSISRTWLFSRSDLELVSTQ
jgi:periplasmic protein TonB